MFDFDKIWKERRDVFDEMFDGMAFFQGCVLNIPFSKLNPALQTIYSEHENSYEIYGIHSEELPPSKEVNRTNLSDYTEAFRAQKIFQIALSYTNEKSDPRHSFNLYIERFDQRIDLLILCRREAILSHRDYKFAVQTGVQEFYKLMLLFGGEALLIGPDGPSVPENNNALPRGWFRAV